MNSRCAQSITGEHGPPNTSGKCSFGCGTRLPKERVFIGIPKHELNHIIEVRQNHELNRHTVHPSYTTNDECDWCGQIIEFCECSDRSDWEQLPMKRYYDRR